MPPSVSEQTDPLDMEILTSFPYPIARAWSVYQLKVRSITLQEPIDTFTALLKYWSIIIASEYLVSDVQSPTG